MVRLNHGENVNIQMLEMYGETIDNYCNKHEYQQVAKSTMNYHLVAQSFSVAFHTLPYHIMGSTSPEMQSIMRKYYNNLFQIYLIIERLMFYITAQIMTREIF